MKSAERFIQYAAILAILVSLLFWSASCVPPGGTLGTPGSTQEEEKTEAQTPTDAVQRTETTTLPPPADLDPLEAWQPYPQDVVPVGEAKLVPGYEPMRRGVTALGESGRKLLQETGFMINTARTVMLAEQKSLVFFPDTIKAQDVTGFVHVDQASNFYFCAFSQKCENRSYLFQTNTYIDLDNKPSTVVLSTQVTQIGESGTAAAGLYGYLYEIIMNDVGDPKTDCIGSLDLDFGEVIPVDYNGDGLLDFGFTIGAELYYLAPTRVEQKGHSLIFEFDPPLCSGVDVTWGYKRSLIFGIASKYAPRESTALAYQISGVVHPTLTYTPDYAVDQGINETVAIAPVAAVQDPNAYNQDKLKELFRTQGVILGMLVLDTDNPNSLLPSGTYLERAYLDNNDTTGAVEFIDVISGEAIYKVQLLAKMVEDASLIIPSASIFTGTKFCLTCLWGWYICRDCFFWEQGMTLDECQRILESLP